MDTVDTWTGRLACALQEASVTTQAPGGRAHFLSDRCVRPLQIPVGRLAGIGPADGPCLERRRKVGRQHAPWAARLGGAVTPRRSADLRARRSP